MLMMSPLSLFDIRTKHAWRPNVQKKLFYNEIFGMKLQLRVTTAAMRILVKVPSRVHYVKYCTRAWARGKYSTRRSRVLYLASRPRPSAIFHVVHERIRYFNWFIVFPSFNCAVLELLF